MIPGKRCLVPVRLEPLLTETPMKAEKTNSGYFSFD